MVGVLLPELDLNVPTPVLPHPFPCSAVRKKKSGLNSSALTHLTLEQISWRLVAMAFAGVSHRNT